MGSFQMEFTVLSVSVRVLHLTNSFGNLTRLRYFLCSDFDSSRLPKISRPNCGCKITSL